MTTTDLRDAVQRLPTWNELCCFNESPSLSPRERAEITRLRETRPGLLFSLVRFLVRRSTSDYTLQKFLGVSWGEIVDMIHDQATRNRELIAAGLEQATATHLSLNPRIDRRHNQLPCTVQTTRRRVAEAKRLCKLDDPILVVGDDDMVGLELVRAGFTDVTSLDIDPKICDMLMRYSCEENLPLRVAVHDIREAPPPDLVGDYRLVFLDPMYSLPGLRLFLESALRLSQRRGGTLFFLSLHLMSLLRQGLPQLPGLFADLELELISLKAGFNAYPIPARLGLLLRLFNRRFMASEDLAADHCLFRFFLSDALLLRKREPSSAVQLRDL